MTTLATHPVADPDQLALIADDMTVLGRSFADRFRDACRAEAEAHSGWVDPNRVRARMLEGAKEFSPHEARQYSGLWAASSGREGFLDKTDRPVQIRGEGSRGNTNKSTVYRKWRGWAA